MCAAPTAPTAPAAAVSEALALALRLARGRARLRRQSAQVRLRALQLGGELQELRPSLARKLRQRGRALALRALVEELARRLLQARVYCREALQHRRYV